MNAEGEGDTPLSVTVQDAADVVTVRLAGELDMDTAGQLVDTFNRILDGDGRNVVLDLGDLEFLDSSGLRVLLDGRERAIEKGATLRVRRPRPFVERVLRISGIAELLGL
ncbi:STAS domain-containing protein [Asanoa sp. NPDC050611]|uniref:STAS domain-containing protein n=1 Tax=Asanoa sp. NPDC050611 TaxID=3157098 RepID=UPI0033D38DCF